MSWTCFNFAGDSGEVVLVSTCCTFAPYWTGAVAYGASWGAIGVGCWYFLSALLMYPGMESRHGITPSPT
jgi:hypothetical protein